MRQPAQALDITVLAAYFYSKEWAMCDILAFKLAGVYKNKVSPTPASFCIADRDWEALSRQFALAGVVPNRGWSYQTLWRMIAYADRALTPPPDI